MSTQPIIVRNPEVFINDRTVQNSRTPFELTNGVFCGYRNASGLPFQDYTGYQESVMDISALVNELGEQCKDPIIRNDRLFKYAEDVSGNKYLLFKSIDVENTITDKKSATGTLKIINNSGELADTFFNITVDGVDFVDFFVFGDLVLIKDEDSVWFGNTRDTKDFISVGYMSYFSCVADTSNVYFLTDTIVNEFTLHRFDGEQIHNITGITQSLNITITSASLFLDRNRILLYRSDTDEVSDDTKYLQIWEYDNASTTWNGVQLTITFPYEVLGAYTHNNKHYVFFEKETFPNNVAGVCIELSEVVAEVITETQPCDDTEDIHITLTGREPVEFSPIKLTPIILLSAVNPPSPLITGGSDARIGEPIETWPNQGTITGDGEQTTLSSQPIYLPYGQGDRYIQFDGVPANSVATVPLSSIGAPTEIDVRVYDIDLRLGADSQTLVSDYANSGNNRSWVMQINSSGQFRMTFSEDGINVNTIFSSTSINPWERGTSCRFTWEAATNETIFYTLENGVWTQFGTTQATPAMASLYDTPNPIFLGAWNEIGATNDRIYGGYARVEIYDEIDGETPLLDIDFSNEEAGVSSFECDTGQIVTIYDAARIIELTKNSPYLYTPNEDDSSATIPVSGLEFENTDSYTVKTKFNLIKDTGACYLYGTRDDNGGGLSVRINDSNFLEVYAGTNLSWTHTVPIRENRDYDLIVAHDGGAAFPVFDVWLNELQVATEEFATSATWDSSIDWTLGGRFTVASSYSTTEVPQCVFDLFEVYDEYVAIDDILSATPILRADFSQATHAVPTFTCETGQEITMRHNSRINSRPMIEFYDNSKDHVDLPPYDFSSGFTVGIKLDILEKDQEAVFFSIGGAPYNFEIKKDSSENWKVFQDSTEIVSVPFGTYPWLRAVIAHNPTTGRISGILNGTEFDEPETTSIAGGGSVSPTLGSSTSPMRGVVEELSINARILTEVEISNLYNYYIAND